MNGPPRDDPDPGDAPDDAPDRSPNPSTDTAAPGRNGSPTDREAGGAGGAADREAVDDPVGDLLPRAGVDSRWWYWIAAIPLYVLVGTAFGLLFGAVALLGVGLGVDGGLVGFGLLFALVVGLGLAGLVLTVLFPIATYVDARAIATSDAPWTPDPLVWGLAALATVVLSAFTLSFVVAVYYLYKRHVAVGTP